MLEARRTCILQGVPCGSRRCVAARADRTASSRLYGASSYCGATHHHHTVAGREDAVPDASRCRTTVPARAPMSSKFGIRRAASSSSYFQYSAHQRENTDSRHRRPA